MFATRLSVAGALCLLVCPFLPTAQADPRSDYFETHVRPLLIEHCVSCHGPDKQESGLRLDSRQHVLHGNDDYDALVLPNQPADSRLLQVIAWSDDDVQMPPEEPLPDSDRAILHQWITDGAVWPESSEFGQITDHSTDWRQHWAFQPISNPTPPADGHPVDAFIRHRLQQEGIEPSPPAATEVLARRLAYALTGLPPASGDLQSARQHNNSQASEFLNDYTQRLLDSPQFGERWARYWLDVSRYSDTKGYVFREDRNYPDAWRYRDWVINALNNDMPWNDFLIRQLAADRFPDEQTSEALAAMGFLTLGRRFLNNKHDIIDDRIDVTMRGMMGLTVACARCHDHKYDPVPTEDYYSLYGIFNSSDEPKNEPSPLRLVDAPQPREPVVFIRGSAGRRGDKVPRQFLTAFRTPDTPTIDSGSGRLELAQAIASPRNPLTARVAVNRVWSHLFGSGLVTSPSDFGTRSDPPSHPELLDHLATWFMEHDWSLKQLVQYIVRSDTWKQSSNSRSELARSDPDNRLLARMPRTRLNFEAHRDSILTVAGRLQPEIGGESVSITSEPFTTRRTLYAHIDRQNLPGLFRTFDFASPDTHAPQRFETTVPQQALYQLNNPFLIEMSQATADLVRQQANSDTDSIQRLYQRILQRPASPVELQAALQFVQSDVAEVPGGWSYGYGTIDGQATQLIRFELLPQYHNNAWQGGPKLPDPTLNWASLNSKGGHPGGGRKLCVVRRWTANTTCSVNVRSQLRHKSEHGDGVTGLILHNDSRLLTSQTVHHSRKPLHTNNVSLQTGDTISFVTFCGANQNHDSFEWQIDLQESGSDGSRQWNAEADFSARNRPQYTDAWTQLAQTLMLTNEFVFVD